MKLALLTAMVLLACVVSSASSGQAKPAPTCTSAASSAVYGQEPVTTWYPAGCVHP